MAIEWSAITGSLLSVGIIIGGFLFLALIGAVAFFVMKERQKYNQFKIILFRKDGFGQTIAEKDTGGIFLNKNINAKRLFLKKNRIGLPPDNVPYVQIGKDKVIFVYKGGLKNFRYIKPYFSDEQVKFTITEEDINWAVNSYQASKASFYLKNKLLEYAPMIMFTIAVMAITIMIIFVLKKFDAIAESATIFRDATANLAVAKASLV